MDTTSEKKRYGQVVSIEEKLSRIYLDTYGREMPDPTPIAPPVGYVKAPSMVDHVRALVARHLSDQAAESGAESFEEANDFDVGDDYEPESPYEALGAEGDMGPLPPEVATMSRAERAQLIQERREAAAAEHSKTTQPRQAGGAEASQTGSPPPPSTTSESPPKAASKSEPPGSATPK